MTLSIHKRLLRFVAAGLSVAILLLSPGPLATRALAQTVTGNVGGTPVAPVAAVGAVPALSAPLGSALPGSSPVALGSALPGGALPSVQVSVQATANPSAAVPSVVSPVSAVASHASADQAAPALASLSLPAAAAAPIPAAGISSPRVIHNFHPGMEAVDNPASVGAGETRLALPGRPGPDGATGPGVTARSTLEAGAQTLSRTGRSGLWSALHTIFTGARGRSGSAADAVLAHTDGAASVPSGLGVLSIEDLEALARDSARPEVERKNAVAAIAKLGGDEAKAALIRVGGANPEGGAADYEVHRASLKALADSFSEVRSLRPVTRGHADQILAKLAADKPELYITDYDDTLKAYKVPLSPENAASLKAVADAGVETVIHTDRPALKDPKKTEDDTVARSIEAMTPSEKAAIAVVSDRGTRIQMSDKAGNLVLVHEEKVSWSEAERQAIVDAARLTTERYGEYNYNGKTEDLSNYAYAKFLPVGLAADRVREAAAFLQAELGKRGLAIQVLGRTPRKDTDPPYLMLSKIDKSIGVKPVRANRRALEQMRDLLRLGLPGRWAQSVWRWLQKLPARPIPASKTLVVGDQFFDAHNADMGFAKGAPGALALAVGGKADPRIENIFVWPNSGETASMEIQAALAKKIPSDMDKKAVAGLFAQRTVSIAAFILTSIAYPFIAVPVVGWAGFGALMALGPLAAIATGPLNGLIADRLSARNAMALNTVIRTVLSLALPAFAALGVLNFWTLLLASFANGWLFSSIMTTENAYIKRLAGSKHVGPVNGLAWMNYLAIQVVLGLIMGVGSVVDQWDPFLSFYISAAAHAFAVLPILWFTMPNLKPNGPVQTVPALSSGISKLRSAMAARTSAMESLFERRGEVPDWEGRYSTLAQADAADKKALEAATAALAKRRGELEAQLAAAKLALAKAEGVEKSLREREIANVQEELSGKAPGLIEKSARFLKRYWLESAVFAAASASYAWLASPLPIAAALLFWIARTDPFRALWQGKGREPSAEEKEMAAEAGRLEREKPAGWEKRVAELRRDLEARRKSLRYSMLFAALSALMMYPLQYFGLPKIAVSLVGETGKGLLLGQFLGALFFGNLIATAAQARLPEVRLPLIGRVPAQRFIQAAVLGLAAVWSYTGLFPGSLLAAGAAALGAAGLMALASKLTNRGWIQLVGAGFAAIWLPFVVWTFPGLIPFLNPQAAMFLSLLAIGMFNGPLVVALNSYFQGNAQSSKMGRLVGVQGSLFNGAISMGYGLLALAAGLFTPSFPPALAVLGVAFLIGGLLFWKAPSVMPGLPPTMTRPKETAK